MLNIRRRLLTPKMTRKVPSQWGRKKERKKKRIKKGTSNPGGKLKVRRGSCNQNIPSCGEISGDRKGPSEDQRRTWWTTCGRQDKVRTVHTVCTAALPSLSHVSPVERRLGAGKWGLEHGPRKGTAAGCEGSLKGQELRSSTTGKVCRRRPGHHRSKAPLLSGEQQAGLAL